MQHWGKNVVIALSLVAAGFFGAYLRFRPHLDQAGSYTDGVHEYGALSDTPVRYAVWDTPESLGDAVNTSAHESRPALSPDGRWMVFAVGERGLNAELWISELVDGEPRNPRPLKELNTRDDELAPAFSDGALFFASNRKGGAGGLDIWRAAFEGGELGHAEPLGHGINTRVDETDPAPVPGSRALAFASNRDAPRGLGYDLFFALPRAAGVYEVEALENLNSKWDEREPAFTADGRTLLFASDRGEHSRQSFDLYRSLYDRGAWLAAEPIEGLNGPSDERAPWPSLDGFSLLFQISDEEAGSDLYRARSLELFRQPSRPVGWIDLAVLIALLLLALLALLAKRWDSLEVLYKCFLVSVVVHLLLLWWFNHIHPEGEEVPVGPGEKTFQVRLASHSSGPPAEARERGGALEVARASEAEAQEAQPQHEALEAPADSPAEARAAELARAERPMESTPERGESAAQPRAAERQETHLRDNEPTLARYDAPATAVVLAARPSTVSAQNQARSASPTRTRSAPAEIAASAPAEQRALERASAGPEVPLPAPRGNAVRPVRADAARVSSTTLAQPDEQFERNEGLPSIVALEQRAVDSAPTERSSAAPARTMQSIERPLAGSPAPLPEEREAAFELTRSAELPAAPRRYDSPVTPAASTAAPAIPLASPVERARTEAPSQPTRESAVALALPAARSAMAPSREAAKPAPTRFRPDSAERAEQAAPSFRPLVADARMESETGPVAPDPFEHTPYRTRFGVAKELAIEEHGGSAETEAAVARGLQYLANIQQREGYWGDVDDQDEKYRFVLVGKTGLAVLAFLSAGHTQESDSEHSRVVRRAIDFLLAVQDEDSGHFGNTASYGHAIATYALAECYALTHDERLTLPLERAAAHIVAEQKRRPRDVQIHGGWGYYFPDTSSWRRDAAPRVSVTVWQVMALESLRLGGISVRDRVFEDARAFIVNAWDAPRGAFRYSHQTQRLTSDYPILPGSTPAALFALSLLGEDLEDAAYRPALRYVAERSPRGYRFRGERSFVERADANLYFWYYGTLAMFRRGGNHWRRWNEAMKETLLPAQASDGSWDPISVYATQYAGDDAGDKSYTTAMCVLTLEVYYRYFTPLLAVDAPAER